MHRSKNSSETELGDSGHRLPTTDIDPAKHSTRPFVRWILSDFVFQERNPSSDSETVRAFDVTLRVSGLGALAEEGIYYSVECEVKGSRGVLEGFANLRERLLTSNEVVEL